MVTMMNELFSRSNNNPPAAQSRLEINPTLIVTWFCTIFSLVVILIRVVGRWVRTERLFREDKVMLYSTIPLLIRLGCVHGVLIFGTNNIDTSTFALSEQEVYRRSIGSRLVLVSRIFYAMYIWVAKVTILEFVQRLIATSWTRFYDRGAKVIYAFLGLTFVGVVVSTLSECQPFHSYWQVVPDPGPACRTGKAQLLTMGVSDVCTDLALMIFPSILVIKARMALLRKISTVILFLLSLIPLAITIYRLQGTAARGYSQQFRSLLASLEILAATAVANIIVIGSFLRDKGVKKVKYRAGSLAGTEDDVEGDVLTRPATRQTKPSIAQRHWGSDEDLVRDFGLSIPADLRHESTAERTARLAPIAEPADVAYHDLEEPEPTINPHGRGLLDPAWSFRKASGQAPRRRDSADSSDSDSSTDFKLQRLEPYRDEPSVPAEIPETPYKAMTFFDVGQLINTSMPERSSDEPHSGRLSRSGHNFIADIGGLTDPPTSAKHGEGSSDSSRHRSGNLLTHENVIRETSRSPARGMSLAQALSETRIANDQQMQRDGTTDPDSLMLGDAGGLLR